MWNELMMATSEVLMLNYLLQSASPAMITGFLEAQDRTVFPREERCRLVDWPPPSHPLMPEEKIQ